ncbi:copper amine oxidase N-terminal domain-containing protein [Marinicrinis sediminis]|uniref:Copper amine oxidase N-terminal domain-containing protein n=1 Tax=Marinicrinis sediminis TaxID=1652465 RepID=A0ABW5R636_9BACL
MKKIVSLFLVLASVVVNGMYPVSTSAHAALSVLINGVPQSNQDYMIVDGRTLIKLRALTDPSWLVFAYDPKTRIVMFHTKDHSMYVYLREGEQTATVNDKQVPLDTAVVNKDGFTYVPLRFVGETLGAYVDYVTEDHRVIVRTPAAQAQYETLMHGDLTEARKMAIALPKKKSADVPELAHGEGYHSTAYFFPEGEALRFIVDDAGYSQRYYEVSDQGFAVLKWQMDLIAEREWGTNPAFKRYVYFDDHFMAQLLFYGLVDEHGEYQNVREIYYGEDRMILLPIEGELRVDAKS